MQDFMKDKKVYFIIVGAILLIAGGIWYYHNENNKSILLIEQTGIEDKKVVETEKFNEDNIQEDETNNNNIEEETNMIMVHIVGQVRNPGVINLKEGSRLIEAIEELGGATEDADLEYVNLAQKLRDEEKIYIPKKGEITKENIIANVNDNTNNHNDDIININTASLEQLKTLSGIGDVIAGNIIKYRETNGGFKSKEEIKQVNRIGDKIYEDIKEKIEI
jgi:competence protein ComEA